MKKLKFKFDGVGWYVTRNGAKIYILADTTNSRITIDHELAELTREYQPLLGVDSTGQFTTWYLDGQYLKGCTDGMDLSHKYIEPLTNHIYLNVYKVGDNTPLFVEAHYLTATLAKEMAAATCVGRVKVILTEGVFDE